MKTLQFMYDIAKEHDNISHPHAIRILNDFQGYTKGSLQKLEHEGLIDLEGQDWAITQKGFKKAAEMYNQQPEHE